MSPAGVAVYRRILAAADARVREPDIAFGSAGELELQARWFSGELGCDWQTTDGLPVRIEDFGRWNHEAGPDFVDARVRVGGVERRGAVELDLDVRDWERHGHATNPAFRETVLHLFVQAPAARFFTRTCDHREVAQVPLAPPPVARAPDLAVPVPITTQPARARAVLEAAARHRLDLKAAALRHGASVHGEDEARFAAFAVALGYKRNQTPFLLLAQRVGLRVAREPRGAAMLFGVAGFLEAPEPPAADRAVRAWLRELWECWWSERARCERWILPRDAWQLAGIRPANHPQRRIAALAGLAGSWKAIRAALDASGRDELVRALQAIDHPFWSVRCNLHARRLARRQALLGAERIRDILLNIHYPLAVDRDDSAWAHFCAERGPAPAAVMRAAAARFFGGAMDSALPLAVVQQGLLQIERDHRSAPDPVAFLAALREAVFPVRSP